VLPGATLILNLILSARFLQPQNQSEQTSRTDAGIQMYSSDEQLAKSHFLKTDSLLPASNVTAILPEQSWKHYAPIASTDAGIQIDGTKDPPKARSPTAEIRHRGSNETLKRFVNLAKHPVDISLKKLSTTTCPPLPTYRISVLCSICTRKSSRICRNGFPGSILITSDVLYV
jgi:hypothetical protein